MTGEESDLSLKLLENNQSDLREFADLSLKLVKELDQRPITGEMQRIRSRYHIDHFFIMQEQSKVGVIRILKGTFYAFGLIDSISKNETNSIIDLIEYDVKSWSVNRIEATIHQDYLNNFLHKNYTIDFSRIKMHLDYDNFTNIAEYNKVKIQNFHYGDMDDVIELFIDAYKGGIDEEIGMFGPDIANSAIHAVLQGNFGKFKPELSPIIYDDQNKMVGALLTTITESYPFVVIIGVRREYQNKGYGRIMISWVIDECKRREYFGMRLWVTDANNSAKNLYQSMGFKQVLQIYNVFKFLD